jgi:subtilisin family serine protease
MKFSTKKLVTFTLGLLLGCPWHTFTSVQAQSLELARPQTQSAKPSKLAPDLEALLTDDDEEQRQMLRGKTLAQVRQERRVRARQRAQADGEDAPRRQRISGLWLPSSEVLAEEKQSFIVQVSRATPRIVLQENLARLGGRIRQTHTNAGLLTIEAPRTIIRQLVAQGDVTYISPDRPVQSSGHLINTTGTAQIRKSSLLTTYDGRGVGVAVIDSGVDTDHLLLTKLTNLSGVVEKLSFITDLDGSIDAFGHGTHVASMIGGGSSVASGYYAGIAPGAKLYSLRALNEQGRGSVSNVIAAIDWCVANRAAKNIRVINLSLGAYAKDSYRNDPLCLAARRAVDAGIVVVAAAGNDGKDIYGNKIYGGIHSPGIDPSVITVGAANTYGTDARADDTVATYSSRGPTRGYTTDANGVRHFDNLIKPDLVAPGYKIIGAAS